MNPNWLNADGTIGQELVQRLIDNKVIGPTAKISFPTYDIDSGYDGGMAYPEVDEVYFNGERIKVLSGESDRWLNDSFPVDISKVKFNTSNELRVEIDIANNQDTWCMSVDWVAIEFDAAAPFVLAHGINAQADTWNQESAPGVLQTMSASGVLFDRFSVPANGNVDGNAKNLLDQIGAFLETVKSKKVNIIAHSKGGLDAQAMAEKAKEKDAIYKFQVLSLSTLSTPHKGSVVADLQLMQRQAIDKYRNETNPTGAVQDFLAFDLAGWASREKGFGPQPPGLNELTIQAANEAIRAGIRGNIANTFTIAADAGPMCIGQPTDAQIEPIVESAGPLQGYMNNLMRLSYQSICTISKARQVDVTRTRDNMGFTRTRLTYTTVVASGVQPNDIVVSVSSAHPGWGTPVGTNEGTNHSTVKNGQNVQLLLNQTIGLR
jgi:pimeloyl-ACP methyl ester carboxylesterase